MEMIIIPRGGGGGGGGVKQKLKNVGGNMQKHYQYIFT